MIRSVFMKKHDLVKLLNVSFLDENMSWFLELICISKKSLLCFCGTSFCCIQYWRSINMNEMQTTFDVRKWQIYRPKINTKKTDEVCQHKKQEKECCKYLHKKRHILVQCSFHKKWSCLNIQHTFCHKI